MGVMLPVGGGGAWPCEPERVCCPACGAETTRDEIRPCGWCDRPGCPECMRAEIDGYVCAEGECAKRLKESQDRVDREWNEKIKYLRRLDQKRKKARDK